MTLHVIDGSNDEERQQRDIETLTRAISSWYVRRDAKYYAVDNLTTKLSRDDITQASLQRVSEEFADMGPTDAVLKSAFNRAISEKHNDRLQSIPVWDGRIRCFAGNPHRFIWSKGMVTVNSWTVPEYRQLGVTEASLHPIQRFLLFFLGGRPAEYRMLLDWLAWCLQNEGEKPGWAPFLYSRTKGSGKSTFCWLATQFFGPQNTVVQNNVDKLTNRFNMTVLQSKLVICEELQLKPGSPHSNRMKTYLTEETTLAEMKGREAETVEHSSCFLFTTNHLPTWIEYQDRRYYVVEIHHNGHSSGDNAAVFQERVRELRETMSDPTNVARVYNALMQRKLQPDFNAKALNPVEQATEVMRSIQAASRPVTVEGLEEFLNEYGVKAIPEQVLLGHVQQQFRINPNSLGHMMNDLQWRRWKVKWGGVDYARVIYTRPGYAIRKGQLWTPAQYQVDLQKHIDGLRFPEATR